MSSPPPLPKRKSLLLVPLRMSGPLVPSQRPAVQMIPAAKATPAKASTITAMPAVAISTASLLLMPSLLLVATAYGQAKPGPPTTTLLSRCRVGPLLCQARHVSIEGARAHRLKARIFTVVWCCELPRIRLPCTPVNRDVSPHRSLGQGRACSRGCRRHKAPHDALRSVRLGCVG